jgi:hypothetical protein
LNLFDSQPVVSIPRAEIQSKIKQLEDAIASLNKELAHRNPNEVEKWGYLGVTGRGKGFIQTGYLAFDTMQEAHDAYMKENPKEDSYAAYYRIHRIYV